LSTSDNKKKCPGLINVVALIDTVPDGIGYLIFPFSISYSVREVEFRLDAAPSTNPSKKFNLANFPIRKLKIYIKIEADRFGIGDDPLVSRPTREESKEMTFTSGVRDLLCLQTEKPCSRWRRHLSEYFNYSVPDHIRPRVCSLPEKAYNPRLSDDLYRLRTFSITNKGGVVNCGDSIINRRSRSNTSVNSTASK
jgi:hypothetical protein